MADDEENGVGRMSAENSPVRKRICSQDTPVKFKVPVTCDMKRCVKVSNLPPPPAKFMEATFRTQLEKFRIRENIEKNSKKTILKVFNHSFTDCSVFVEFNKMETAEALCKCQTKLMHMKYQLTLEPVIYLNDTMIGNPSTPPSGTLSGDMANWSPFNRPVRRNPFTSLFKDTPMDLSEPIALDGLHPNANSTLLESAGGNDKIGAPDNHEDEFRFAEGTDNNEAPDNDEGLSCKVQVGNLPKKLSEGHFLDFLNNEIRAKLFLYPEEEPAFSLSDHSDKDSTIIVQFRTVKEAREACRISTLYSGKYVLTFQHLPLAKPIAEMSCEVEVGNLPKKFFMDHFLDFINEEVGSKLGLVPEEETATCFGYDQTAATITVKFRTVEEARVACTIKSMYDGKYSLYYNQLPKQAKLTCNVEVSNLPKKLHKDHFLNFINDYLRSKLDLGEEEQAALTASDPSNDMTIVKFRTVPEATEACRIQAPYGKYNLKFNQIEEAVGSATKDANDNRFSKDISIITNPAQTCNNDNNEKILTDDNEKSTMNEDEIINKNKVSLKTYEGDIIFLKALIKCKNLFKDTRNYPTAFARLLVEIGTEIDSDIPTITKRRKHFLDIYNKKNKLGKEDYLHHRALKVAFGAAKVDSLEGTEYAVGSDGQINLSDPDRVAETAAIFSKGAVFNVPASLALLRIIRENLDVYKTLLNRDAFWEEASRILKESGHHHSASRCENRFQDAQKLYRSELQRLQRSGAPTLAQNQKLWFMCDDMLAIMDGDFSAIPPIQIACGTSSFKKVNLTEPEDVDDPHNHQSKQIGKARIPQMRRPKSKADKNNEAIHAIAAAMNRRTDVLAARNHSFNN